MKLGIVYTSTTPELIECVNEEIRKNLGDTPEILNYQDPSILAEVREHGYELQVQQLALWECTCRLFLTGQMQF